MALKHFFKYFRKGWQETKATRFREPKFLPVKYMAEVQRRMPANKPREYMYEVGLRVVRQAISKDLQLKSLERKWAEGIIGRHWVSYALEPGSPRHRWPGEEYLTLMKMYQALGTLKADDLLQAVRQRAQQVQNAWNYAVGAKKVKGREGFTDMFVTPAVRIQQTLGMFYLAVKDIRQARFMMRMIEHDLPKERLGEIREFLNGIHGPLGK